MNANPLTPPGRCQCEHFSHFDAAGGAHTYGETIPAESLRLVRSVFGEYFVCVECEANHPIPADMRELESGGERSE